MVQISWDLVLLFHPRYSPASASWGLVLQARANIPGFSSLNSRLEIPIHWSVIDFLTCLHYPTVHITLPETVNDSGLTFSIQCCSGRTRFLPPGHYPASQFLSQHFLSPTLRPGSLGFYYLPKENLSFPMPIPLGSKVVKSIPTFDLHFQDVSKFPLNFP